jgi:xanthine dehydrogenase small subunit
VLLPSVHGREVHTVEGLKSGAALHPAQSAMVEALGSQCGYCTPGVVMSLFEACYRADLDEPWKLDDQLAGNLCRCTGYRPIRDAAQAIAGLRPADRFQAALERAAVVEPEPLPPLDYRVGPQRFVRPTRLSELLAFLAEAPDARLVAGATDLGLEVTKRWVEHPLLVSVEAVPELRGISHGPDGWCIGAATPLAELEAAAREALPPLERMLRFFGARQIKNRGTVGGNLCTASPIGDLPPVLLALDAQVVLASLEGDRALPIADFFLGYRKTALRAGEVLRAVRIPSLPERGVRAAAYKVSKRQELDISTVSAAFFVELEPDGARVRAARLAFGGMAATPARAARAEAALVGRPFTEAGVADAVEALASDFAPIDDHRGSAWYRRTLAQNLLLGFVLETAADPMPRLLHRPTGTVDPERRPRLDEEAR